MQLAGPAMTHLLHQQRPESYPPHSSPAVCQHFRLLEELTECQQQMTFALCDSSACAPLISPLPVHVPLSLPLLLPLPVPLPPTLTPTLPPPLPPSLTPTPTTTSPLTPQTSALPPPLKTLNYGLSAAPGGSTSRCNGT